MSFPRYFKVVILGTLGTPEQTHLKLQHQFRALLNQIFCLVYFGHAHQTTRTKKDNINLKITLLFTDNIAFIPNFFHGILLFKESCNLTG